MYVLPVNPVGRYTVPVHTGMSLKKIHRQPKSLSTFIKKEGFKGDRWFYYTSYTEKKTGEKK
jgi:hypothetical protein